MARALRIEIENGSFRPFEGMAHFRPRGNWPGTLPESAWPN